MKFGGRVWKIFWTQPLGLGQILYHFILFMNKIFCLTQILQLPSLKYWMSNTIKAMQIVLSHVLSFSSEFPWLCLHALFVSLCLSLCLCVCLSVCVLLFLIYAIICCNTYDQKYPIWGSIRKTSYDKFMLMLNAGEPYLHIVI